IGVNAALTQKVFANMRRVGKGFLGVETPLFEGMLVAGEIQEQGDAEEEVQDDIDDAAAQGADAAVEGDDEALDACATLTRRVEHLEYDKVAQALEVTKLKRRVKQLERGNKVKSKFSTVGIKLDITSNSSDSPLVGVNTPRSDEDRLKIMELMVFQLPKLE
nr:hypothetical protein [Tanacetum cinerariifolium]